MKNIIFILLCLSQYSFAQLANWTAYKPEKFPTNLSGQIHGQARIVQMKFHPSNPNKYYAVTAQGGLFISNDQAATWNVVAGTDILSIKNASICIDHSNDQILYLGGGDPNYYGSGSGIYKSTNGGATFTQLTGGFPTNKIVVEIIMDATDPNLLVAATSGGIYKSTNAGSTWTAKTSTSLQFSDMKQGTAANSQILFASTTENSSDLYRSTDFGSTWTQITSGISTPSVAPVQYGSRIGVTPANPDVVYFGQVTSGGMMYKSTDGGLNFTLMKGSGSPYITYYNDDSGSSSQGNYNYCFTVDRLDANKIWLQAHNTWYSSDGGATWTMLTFWSQKVHTDMHQITQSPYDATKLYSCNDGGVWLSTDGGNNWAAKNDGIFAYEIANYAGKGSPTRRDFINIGTQDNGELYADSTGWYTIRGGDWYSPNQMDYRANSTMLYYGENAKRRFPTGSQATFGLPNAVKYAQIAFNRTNNLLAFVALSDTILRTTDLQATTPTWTQLAKLSGSIKAVHSSIADANYLYVLTSDQKIHVSTNALSATPTFTAYNLPTALNNTATITAICNNANILYIAINNMVYRSADAGATWTNVTYNLPSVNHQQILSESYGGTEELVFIATANAVYYKKSAQTSWTLYATNLPNRKSPTDFSIYDDGTNQALIRWATYGRGIWQTPFGNLRPLQAYALAEKASNVCTANQFNFKNASNGNYNSVSWSFPSGTPSTSTAENPVVTYSAIGTYTATVTVTDGSGATSSTSITVNVTRLDNCSVDGYAGKSLKTTSDGDFLVRTKADLTNLTSFSVTAWIKPNGAQAGFAGIVSNGEWGAHYATNTNGLVFDYNGTKLWYRWAGISDTWASNSGLTVPLNEWSYVAMVLTPDSVALYLNDQKYVYVYPATGVHKPTAASISELYLGYGHYSKSFKGEMDEVSIWKRALTQNEIRDMRHLTKESVVSDAHLIAYYQFNDLIDNQILDKKRTYHGVFGGNATLATSTAPVATGTSQRINVATGGIKDFTNSNVSFELPLSAILPDGEIVVSELNAAPDQLPTGGTPLNNKYWIINNYGTYPAFTPLLNLKFKSLIGLSSDAPNYKLYRRNSNAEGATWGTTLDGGDNLASNTLTFTPAAACVGISAFGQFAITDDVSATPPVPSGDACSTKKSLSLATNQSFSSTVNLTNVTQFTTTAWIKPNGAQAGFAGIVSNGEWGAHYATNTNGLIFDYYGTKLWYRWAGVSDTWASNSGMTVPLNEWSYVGMVVTNDSIALYLNDQKYVHVFTGTEHRPTAASINDLYIGYGHYSKYFNGEIEEVRVWNKALTQDQIREMRHLTNNNAFESDANFLAYYQFEEQLGGKVVNKARNVHGALNNSATLVASTAPVGSGVSQKMLVTSGGLKTFATPNVDVTFPTTGIFPNGEIVVTRLDVAPDQNPTGGTAVNKTWIINNYGLNATFTPLNSLKINDLNGFGTGVATNCKLYKRSSNADGATWTTPIDGGDNLISSGLVFNPISPCLGITSFGQLTITDDVTASLPTPCIAQAIPTQAATFTGSSTSNFKSVVPAPNFGTSQNFTIAFWVKSANTASDATIISDKNWGTGLNKGWVFAYSTNKIRFNIGDATNRIDLYSQTGLNDNQWHHIAASVTRTGNAILYVDGVNKASTSATALTDIYTGYALTMGTDALNNYPLLGQLDEVKIWETALSQDQIREKMHLTTTLSEANLLDYYQFNNLSAAESDFGNQGNNLTAGAAVTRSTSTVPVAGGTSQRMTVTTGGVKDFTNQHLSLEFPNSGALPNGEIVVSELAASPDGTPSGASPLTGKYWVINNYGTNATFGALTSLQLSNLGNFGTGAAANYKLYKRNSNLDGATWGSSLGSADALTTANNNTLTFGSSCNITSFSQITMVSEVALPVELISFRGQRQGNVNLLFWETASERNNIGFDVEKSSDGVSFQKIGFVKGQGTTAVPQQYQFTDAAAFGVTYYRLKQLDASGHWTYSNTISIVSEAKTENLLEIFPNPTDGLLNVNFASNSTQSIDIELVNALGQVVQRHVQAAEMGANRFSMQLLGQVSGMYTLRVMQGRQVYMRRVCLR
jgi:Concanavalin A-like lectin/glucanases superfamily/PKD domain/Secretion system C-terminal sorting domain